MSTGEFRLGPRKQKDGSAKVTYHIQRNYRTAAGNIGWRMTLFRLEWYPRRKTWRVMETRARRHTSAGTHWEQIIVAELGDTPEAEACAVAINTAILGGMT